MNPAMIEVSPENGEVGDCWRASTLGGMEEMELRV
jgi:hypothetical protein